MITKEQKLDVIDRVTAHLLSQGEAARDSAGRCAYRTRDGKRCAVGFLIDDAHYFHSLESCACNYDTVQRALAASLGWDIADVREATKPRAWLYQLQFIHDGCSVENWPSRLAELRTQVDADAL